MPWVRFVKDFNFRPPERPQSHLAFKAGMASFVRKACAEQAIAEGKAVVIKKPI